MSDVITRITALRGNNECSEAGILLTWQKWCTISEHLTVFFFYFHCLPRLWNSFPKIDLSLPIQAIKHKLNNYMWEHFLTILSTVMSTHFITSAPVATASHHQWPDSTVYMYIDIFLYALFVSVGVPGSTCQLAFSTVKR